MGCTMKKSFKLFIDSLDVLDELSDEQAGQLFKAIHHYELDGTEILTGLMKAVFTPFKNNIDRAKAEYEAVCERNRANGLKGGRPSPNKPTGLKSNPNNPDKDKDKEKEKEKGFSFALKNLTRFESLSAEYKQELEKYIASCQGITFEDFKSSCLIKNYKYANFKMAYNKWNKNVDTKQSTSTIQARNKEVLI